MILLHDSAVRNSIGARIGTLSATTRPRWGRMSVDQMLWHCNQVFRTSLGEIQVVPRRPPFPVPMLKFMLFNLPWPHGAPTAPEYQANATHDFDAEWAPAVFGPISGREWSCLHARHLDHHLRQFNA